LKTTQSKIYYVQSNIGKAKYVVNYYDGVKTHPDGSRFFDIGIFKNKTKEQSFIKNLLQTGYQYR
jgi:hypothetical protein